MVSTDDSQSETVEAATDCLKLLKGAFVILSVISVVVQCT